MPIVTCRGTHVAPSAVSVAAAASDATSACTESAYMASSAVADVAAANLLQVLLSQPLQHQLLLSRHAVRAQLLSQRRAAVKRSGLSPALMPVEAAAWQPVADIMD